MADLSIKIKILDREYPIRVPASQEEKLRKAGKEINDKLKEFKAQFGIDDKQDLLAMLAIDSVVEKYRLDESKADFSAVANKIDNLDKLISSVI